MWRIKDPSVCLCGVCPQIVAAIGLADQVWAHWGAGELVITSAADGAHSPTSLHYAGAAVDLRTRNLPDTETRRRAVTDLGNRLGPDFDVVLEGEGTANEHVHLEWQPKRRSSLAVSPEVR